MACSSEILADHFVTWGLSCPAYTMHCVTTTFSSQKVRMARTTDLQNHITRVDDFDVGLSSDGQTSTFLRSAVHGGLRLDLVVVAVGLAGAVGKLRRGYEDKE